MNSPRIIIAGGGAAGFFASISAAELNPRAQVLLLEKLLTFSPQSASQAEVDVMSPTPALILVFFQNTTHVAEKPYWAPFNSFRLKIRWPGFNHEALH